MRLMSKEGQQTPIDKYLDFRDNPELWEKEMEEYGLIQSEKDILHNHFDYCFGVPSQQEDLQNIVMDTRTWGYDVGQSTHCRKVISKIWSLYEKL